ncbi:Zinc ABC transporter, ATP-binding protein ZnuC [Candidatus Desulforudis audaxviator]|nr:Zinc ABC transporter, ATP-binding protein ZnuC [Candidatus Desulforudis audaxviator]
MGSVSITRENGVVVSLEEVSVSIRGVRVLDGIDLEVAEGAFVAVIGPNGAGKTTLARVILGLVRPDSGRVLLFGKPPNGPQNRKHLVGYLPQRQQFDPGFPVSAHDVVMMGRVGCIGLFRFPSRADKDAATETLRRIGFRDTLIGKPIGELSGGQQQLAFLGRALCSHTRLLILDEPTNGLDLVAQRTFYRVVRELQRNFGLTILVVSHDITSVAGCADEMICLKGSVHARGTAREVLASPGLAEAYGAQPLGFPARGD